MPNCYLPPDFEGDTLQPCGINPAEVYVEGEESGRTSISATVEEGGETVIGSTKIQVDNHASRIAVISPRWGDKLHQGAKNLIAWRCPECSPSAHMLLTIYNDDKSSGGSIAYQQPTNGSFIWNAKTVCSKEIQTSTRECHDLLPGYYWIGLAVEAYGGDMMHAPMASSAPFQIRAQKGAGQSAEVTSNRVKGFIVAGSVASDKFFWLQTAASGKRLICLSPATAVDIPWRLPASPPLFFTASDLPWGTPIEATGVWENAHSLGCSGTGTDPDAPPRLRVSEVSVAGSGIFGIYKKCKKTDGREVCRDVSYVSVEIPGSGGGKGQYLAPRPPGHFHLLGTPVDVKPSHWTRLDIKLPE